MVDRISAERLAKMLASGEAVVRNGRICIKDESALAEPPAAAPLVAASPPDPFLDSLGHRRVVFYRRPTPLRLKVILLAGAAAWVYVIVAIATSR